MARKAKEFKPGDFVFAKVKGYPAWPARVRALKGKKYMVLFYGTNEVANLPSAVIYDYAENKDKFMGKSIKKKEFSDGIEQIEREIADGTEMLPLEEAEEGEAGAAAEEDTTLGGGDETATEADETVIEAEQTTEAEAEAEPATAEEEDAADSEDDQLVIDEPKKKAGRKNSSSVADTSTKAKSKKEKEATPAKATPAEAEEGQEAPQEAESTVQKKVPKSAQKGKRSSKAEAATAKPDEADTPQPEIVSRSGRKIKPKRFLDNSEENTPVSKRARSSESLSIAAEHVRKSKETEDNLDQAPSSPMDTVNPGMDSMITSTPMAKPSKGTAPKKTKYQLLRLKQLENPDLMKERSQKEDQSMEDLLLAKLTNGKLIGVKIFPNRPAAFKNEIAKQQWEQVAIKSAVKLKQVLESGSLRTDSIVNQLIMDLNLTAEETAELNEDLKNETEERRLSHLKMENTLLELDMKIRGCLGVKKAYVDKCIEYLDEFGNINLASITFLKHPTIVNTISRIRRYVGNPEDWDYSEAETVNFHMKAHSIRKRAERCYDLIKSKFLVPEGVDFNDIFREKLQLYQKLVEKLSENEQLQLVSEPPEMLLKDSMFANSTVVSAAKKHVSTKSDKKSTSRTVSTPKANNGLSSQSSTSIITLDSAATEQMVSMNSEPPTEIID